MRLKDWLLVGALLLLLGVGMLPTVAAETDTNLHTTATCAVTSTLALAANEGRVAALIVNTSTQVVWLGIGVAAVVNEGIPVNANNGSYSIGRTFDNYDS